MIGYLMKNGIILVSRSANFRIVKLKQLLFLFSFPQFK